MAKDARLENAMMAATASMAAARSPYAAGAAKADGSDGETTPGTRKLRPMKRIVWGKTLGLKRVILVGHSMGGPVALAAAKRLPGTVVAVVGVDTLQRSVDAVAGRFSRRTDRKAMPFARGGQ